MWRRVVGPFREFGLVAGALYAVDRILRGLSPRLSLFVYELMVQPITAKPMLSANLTKNLRFAEIPAGSPEIALMPAREDIKAERFEQGARCLGVYRREKLIGYIWFCFERYHEDEVRCTYELSAPAASVFDFDLYVMPEHRMGIGFMAIWHGANEYLHARGIRYTFSRLTRFNTASRRAHAHLGWRRVAQAVFLKIGPIELMAATTAPFVAVTASSARRVNLRLKPDVLLGSATQAPGAATQNAPEPEAKP